MIPIFVPGPMTDTPFKACISLDMGFFKVSHKKLVFNTFAAFLLYWCTLLRDIIDI